MASTVYGCASRVCCRKRERVAHVRRGLSAPGPAVFETLAAAIREERYTTDADLSPGARVHHYEVLDPIGSGGMSRVYAARHIYLDQKVALKTLPRAAGREHAERFLREARALAALAGPGLIRVFDAGIQEGLPFIITELLNGKTVAAAIAERHAITPNLTIDLLEQVGQVLVRQERHDLLHRDIKPQNVFIRPDGTYCLFDYGLAGYAAADASSRPAADPQLTATGAVMGTPLYVAPEQANGSTLDIRTDLFGLGMTAWECLAGRPARRGKTTADLFAAAATGVTPIEEVSAHVPADLASIVNTLVATEPGDRYASAGALLADLDRVRSTEGIVGAVRGTVFVAMPFKPGFEETFACLRRACAPSRLLARRVDRIVYVENIWGQIVQEIEQARLVVADFSCQGLLRREPNPNVLTEAAHARAVGKPLLIITRDAPERLPFDWRHVPVIRYGTSRADFARLEEQLAAKVRHCVLQGST